MPMVPHISRGLLLFAVAPFLLGFEPRRARTPGSSTMGSPGWQGRDFGAWLGHAYTQYESTEILLSLSYRLRSATLFGTAGLFTADNGFASEVFERGEASRLALGVRFPLKP